MKDLHREGGSLSYGRFDEGPSVLKLLMTGIVFGAMGLICYGGYVHGTKLERAALGESKAAGVTKNQKKKAGQITEDNREWLTSITNGGK
jgi:hypothetical protein